MRPVRQLHRPPPRHEGLVLAPRGKCNKGLRVSEQHACSATISSPIYDPKRTQQMNHEAQNTACVREGRQGEGRPAVPGLCRRAHSGEDVQVERPFHTQHQLLTGKTPRELQAGTRPAAMHPRAPTKTLLAGAQRGKLPEAMFTGSTNRTSACERLCVAELPERQVPGESKLEKSKAAGHSAGRWEEGPPWLRTHSSPPPPEHPAAGKQRGREQAGSGAGVRLHLERVTSPCSLRIPVCKISFWRVKSAQACSDMAAGMTRT